MYITGMQRASVAAARAGRLTRNSAELYLVSSSAEVGIIDRAAARDLVAAASPEGCEGPHAFVSMACLGFFAGVLEFMRTGARDARLLLIEAPADFVQATLDQARLGGEGGFVAQEAAYIVDLSREPRPGALRLYACEILARAPVLTGTALLAKRMHARMARLRAEMPDTEWVSFENGSEWSRRLAQSFGDLARRDAAAWRFAPSVEHGRDHYMTVRPLLDLAARIDIARRRPLALSCLGAGGRFGLAVVGPASGAGEGETARGAPIDLGPARTRAPTGEEPCAPAQVHYVREEFYGRDNAYFKWTMREGAPGHA